MLMLQFLSQFNLFGSNWEDGDSLYFFQYGIVGGGGDAYETPLIGGSGTYSGELGGGGGDGDGGGGGDE